MKRTFLFLSLVALTFSCNKVSDKNVDKTITEGQWKVTLFSEDGENETYYFTGYSFQFDENGSVTATNGSTTVSGTWSTSDSGDDVDFNLYFPATNNFDELSDDWHVLNLSETKIELEDVSGGDGSVDQLTFEKI